MHASDVIMEQRRVLIAGVHVSMEALVDIVTKLVSAVSKYCRNHATRYGHAISKLESVRSDAAVT
jgi:hypothetical protein